jgi:hypothetical protein
MYDEGLTMQHFQEWSWFLVRVEASLGTLRLYGQS